MRGDESLSQPRTDLLRWVLRECIRANPLYVISAALFCWGVLELTQKIDPKVGHAWGVCAAAGLIHAYEFCLLIVATIVLVKRREGGRDMHGLLIVAGLFLSGGLIALDEMINLWPGYAPAWIAGALLLAGIKLEWYARLPGLYLPARYRWTALAVLAAHAVPALLASKPCDAWLTQSQQLGLGKLAGWLSLAGIFALLACELRRHGEQLKDFSIWRISEAELIQTHVPGVWLLALTATLGQVHSYMTDWVFDRALNPRWTVPAACLVAAMWLLQRFTFRARRNALDFVLAALPFGLVCWVWHEVHPWRAELVSSVSYLTQAGWASALAYLGLAWATGHSAFLLGLVASACVPSWPSAKSLVLRQERATLLIVCSFLALIGGAIVSLYRKRLLALLEPAPVAPRPADQDTSPPAGAGDAQ